MYAGKNIQKLDQALLADRLVRELRLLTVDHSCSSSSSLSILAP